MGMCSFHEARSLGLKMIDWNWIRDRLGIGAIAADLLETKKTTVLIQRSIIDLNRAGVTQAGLIRKLENLIMALPLEVQAAIAKEFEDGGKFQSLIAELKKSNAALKVLLENRPELGAGDIIVNQAELIAEIEKINPAFESEASPEPEPTPDPVVEEPVAE